MSKKNVMQSQQQVKATPADLAELVAAAYSDGGERHCRKVARQMFETVVNQLSVEITKLSDKNKGLESEVTRLQDELSPVEFDNNETEEDNSEEATHS